MLRIQPSRAPKRRILGDISNISNVSLHNEDKHEKKLKIDEVGLPLISTPKVVLTFV